MRIVHITEFDKDNNVAGVHTWEIPNKVFDALMDIAGSPVCDTNHEVVIRREAGLFTVWRLPRRQDPISRGRHYPEMAPLLPGETIEQYTDRLTGADGTGRVPYDHRRRRQCSIGYHDECSDPQGKDCKCPCHTQRKDA